MYDYANILFTGKCNLDCYECIGKSPQLQGLPANTAAFPPRNVDALIEMVNRHNIKDLAFTGTNADPQLYRHEKELVGYIRKRLIFPASLSLHTNGLLALRKIDEFNSYDKASVSFPSYNTNTYAAVAGRRKQPDIKAILQAADIPVKLSMLVTPHNIGEISDYLQQSADLGVKRIVVRKLKGREQEFPLERVKPFANQQPVREVFGWPVYNIHGIEVTICAFDKSTAKGLFLISDGRLEDRLV